MPFFSEISGKENVELGTLLYCTVHLDLGDMIYVFGKFLQVPIRNYWQSGLSLMKSNALNAFRE